MERKFKESKVSDQWEVLSDGKWVDVVTSHNTVEYAMWMLKTKSHELICADDHLVFRPGMIQATVQELLVGDKLITENGIEEVIEVRSLDDKVDMYDLQVNSFDQSYYTNGILSHNTATAALYLLWYAMFNPDKNILVASYKMDGVVEILDRIRYAYESCPDHIRCGVTTYANKRIVFDNNSSIVGQTMTENTGRGMSISLLYCLDGNTNVDVKDKETGEVKTVSLEGLYTELNDDVLEGFSLKPMLRMQFTDKSFMDVPEDMSFHVNGIKTTIEHIVPGDSILYGNDELEVSEIYMLDANGQAIL